MNYVGLDVHKRYRFACAMDKKHREALKLKTRESKLKGN